MTIFNYNVIAVERRPSNIVIAKPLGCGNLNPIISFELRLYLRCKLVFLSNKG